MRQSFPRWSYLQGGVKPARTQCGFVRLARHRLLQSVVHVVLEPWCWNRGTIQVYHRRPSNTNNMGLSNESPQVTPSPGCPVDHSSDSWKNMTFPAGHPPVASHSSAPSLSQERVVSSIPRRDGSNWVYPSQAQFYSAMARKNHNPQAVDMRVVVPIHNAVNERAWGEVMRWEKDQGGEECGGVKLVSFKGRPQDRTIRAWCNVLLG